MSVFPVVKGVRLRATKVNSCGLPVEGPGNRVVTDGFVTVTLSPVMQDAEELEQKNAEGRTCVIDRTPPERKYYNVTVVLCQVNTCLISMFTSWEQEVNYAGDSVGFRDDKEVESDYGVAIEVWSGGSAEDDCPDPVNDDIFANPSSGKSYGYFLFFGKEFVPGDMEIGASVMNFTLTGITFDGPQWGRGPYNVIPIDDANTAGRLLTPIGQHQQLVIERTPVPPPDITPGAECCPLDISTTFVDPDFYFGGPASEPAADVAPDQPDCDVPDDLGEDTVTQVSTPKEGDTVGEEDPIDGVTEPNAEVGLYINGGHTGVHTPQETQVADSSGAFAFDGPLALPDGPATIEVRRTGYSSGTVINVTVQNTAEAL